MKNFLIGNFVIRNPVFRNFVNMGLVPVPVTADPAEGYVTRDNCTIFFLNSLFAVDVFTLHSFLSLLVLNSNTVF